MAQNSLGHKNDKAHDMAQLWQQVNKKTNEYMKKNWS